MAAQNDSKELSSREKTIRERNLETIKTNFTALKESISYGDLDHKEGCGLATLKKYALEQLLNILEQENKSLENIIYELLNAKFCIPLKNDDWTQEAFKRFDTSEEQKVEIGNEIVSLQEILQYTRSKFNPWSQHKQYGISLVELDAKKKDDEEEIKKYIRPGKIVVTKKEDAYQVCFFVKINQLEKISVHEEDHGSLKTMLDTTFKGNGAPDKVCPEAIYKIVASNGGHTHYLPPSSTETNTYKELMYLTKRMYRLQALLLEFSQVLEALHVNLSSKNSTERDWLSAEKAKIIEELNNQVKEIIQAIRPYIIEEGEMKKPISKRKETPKDVAADYHPMAKLAQAIDNISNDTVKKEILLSKRKVYWYHLFRETGRQPQDDIKEDDLKNRAKSNWNQTYRCLLGMKEQARQTVEQSVVEPKKFFRIRG